MNSDLENAIYVFRLLSNPVFSGRSVSGEIVINYDTCKAKLSDPVFNAFFDDKTFSVEFDLPNKKNELFLESMEDLLCAPSRLVFRPEDFYIADIDFHFSDSLIIPDVVKQYLDVSKFANTLAKISDYFRESIPEAIFLQGEKITLSLKYSNDNLSLLNGLDGFINDFIDADIHKDQKTTILKCVLIDMLKNNEIDRLNIVSLINRFPEFLERVYANYSLYVSEFSFDKIKEQVESEKLEFTIKLNKVFSDIQNQLLAIPVAFLISSKPLEGSSDILTKNIFFFIGILIFGLIMSLLIRNQKSSLLAIGHEIDSQWRNSLEKNKLVADRLETNYSFLKDRVRYQGYKLKIIDLSVTILIVINLYPIVINII